MPQIDPTASVLAPAALHIESLRHAYEGQDVLTLPALTLAPAEHMLVLGPSGSGKTTLLHVVAGLLKPTQGQVTVNGQDLSALSPAALDQFRGRYVGIVFQRLHLLPALSVLGNLQLAQRLAGDKQDAQGARVLLDALNIGHLAARKPAHLSTGQAQRVAIARALVHKPALLLADEPTSSLDDANGERALGLLREHAQAAGAALLVVSHDQRLRGKFDKELRLEPPT